MKALELAVRLDSARIHFYGTHAPVPKPIIEGSADELRRLAKVNAELLEIVKQAQFLCDWIMETPHQRGSINGAAAQLLYAITNKAKG